MLPLDASIEQKYNTFWKVSNFPKGLHKKEDSIYFTSSLT
jgi:hypothetical protein